MTNHLKLNTVLKSWDEVIEAIENLNSLNLPPHPHKIKSWDTWKILNFINQNGDKASYILDVGCNGSPILPLLHKLGFENLYGCDVDLRVRKRRLLRRIKNRALFTDPDEILNQMLENKNNFFNLSVENLEQTNFDANMFDFISSLSVIEHGVDIEKYFLEMNRILKTGGFLLTSTDYWPEKIETSSNVYNRPEKDKIFDKNEIFNVLKIAEKHDFELYESIDFGHRDKVMRWKKTGKEYTFIFFCLKKKK